MGNDSHRGTEAQSLEAGVLDQMIRRLKNALTDGYEYPYSDSPALAEHLVDCLRAIVAESCPRGTAAIQLRRNDTTQVGRGGHRFMPYDPRKSESDRLLRFLDWQPRIRNA